MTVLNDANPPLTANANQQDLELGAAAAII